MWLLVVCGGVLEDNGGQAKVFGVVCEEEVVRVGWCVECEGK